MRISRPTTNEGDTASHNAVNRRCASSPSFLSARRSENADKRRAAAGRCHGSSPTCTAAATNRVSAAFVTLTFEILRPLVFKEIYATKGRDSFPPIFVLFSCAVIAVNASTLSFHFGLSIKAWIASDQPSTSSAANAVAALSRSISSLFSSVSATFSVALSSLLGDPFFVFCDVFTGDAGFGDAGMVGAVSSWD